MHYFVYICKCKDGSLYTGYTLNAEKRINAHNFSALGAKSIKGKLPVVLVHKEVFNDKLGALKREREIKGWSRKKKQKLIELALMARHRRDRSGRSLPVECPAKAGR